MPPWLQPLIDRWYAFVPWLLVLGVAGRSFGWARSLIWAGGGWLLAFAAEWASTAGPGGPFGHYFYRAAGLRHDWVVAGVPIFDSLSFSWLTLALYGIFGAAGARGWRRVLLTGVGMMGVDLVVDPVSLRGSRWLLGSIYGYPSHTGVWFGVSVLNYVGWLILGLVLAGWSLLCFSDFRWDAEGEALAAAVLSGLCLVMSGLAIWLGIWPAAGAALITLGVCLWLARAGTLATGGSPRLIVACALASEAAAARRGLGGSWRRARARGAVRWVKKGEAVEVWQTGLGLAAAGSAGRMRPVGAVVLVAGVGGASSGDWEVGDSGVGTEVIGPAGDRLTLSSGASRGLVAAGVGSPTPIRTLSAPAESSADRAAAARDGGPLLEMETYPWVASAPARGATVALRVVLDTPARPLGPIGGLVPPGASGPDSLLVAGLLLRHPARLPALLRLGGRQRLCLERLGQAVALAAACLLSGELGSEQEAPAASKGP